MVIPTLYLWVGHEVEEAGEQGVGCGVGPSKVKIQNRHDESILRERGAIIASLEGDVWIVSLFISHLNTLYLHETHLIHFIQITVKKVSWLPGDSGLFVLHDRTSYKFLKILRNDKDDFDEKIKDVIGS